MTKKSCIILILVTLFSFRINGQPIYNAMSFKDINSEKYIRLTYENDYFASADWYYSQGILVELVSPKIKKFMLSRLLLHPKYAYVRHGLGIEHDIYTPVKTDRKEILSGDRPYAACLLLNTFLMSRDSVRKQRFASTLSLGVIGPAAGAMDMQTEVHRFVPHNSIPMGWVSQVQNDAILNYQASYEKQVFTLKRFLSLDANGMVRAGTLSDKVSVGVTALLGNFDSPFGVIAPIKNKFRFYAYEHPEVSIVGYDATLQGGIFNKTSSYTISAGDICRFTFQNRFGFVVVINRVNLEFFQAFITREYARGLTHTWGGIHIAYEL